MRTRIATKNVAGGLDVSARHEMAVTENTIGLALLNDSTRPPWIEAEKAPQTMSSLEIAEITGKNHADVMRDIRAAIDQDGGDASKFAGVYLGGNGEERPCYNLPRYEWDLLITGYSVRYRGAVIRRWHELEKNLFQSVQDMSTSDLLAEVIRRQGVLEADKMALIERTQSVIRLTSEAASAIGEIRECSKEWVSAANFVECFENSGEEFGIRELSKKFGVGQNYLASQLIGIGAVYREGSHGDLHLTFEWENGGYGRHIPGTARKGMPNEHGVPFRATWSPG